MSKTAISGETTAQTDTRTREFLDGLTAGTFLLMPGVVTQAAACDGNWYSIAYNYYEAYPGTYP